MKKGCDNWYAPPVFASSTLTKAEMDEVQTIMLAAAELGQSAQAAESKEKMLHPQHFLLIVKANRGESAQL